MLLEKYKNFLELSAKQLVIQSSLASSISLCQTVWGVKNQNVNVVHSKVLFFRTTTDNIIRTRCLWRFFMTFLTNLGVTEILYSFGLVLKGKTGKEIPKSSRLEFIEKRLANSFTLSDTEDNTSGSFNRGVMVNLPLLRRQLAIHQKSWEPRFWEVMGSFVLLAYANSAASRTLLQQVLASMNFAFRRLFCWYKWKKWFLWTMTAAQAVENHGDEWSFQTWYFWWELYTSIPTWAHSQNSLAAAETLSLRISSHGICLKWSWRASQSAWE